MKQVPIAMFAAGLPVLTACSTDGQFMALRETSDSYRDVAAAEAAGGEEFLGCFDSDARGMGQHHIDVAALEGTVVETHLESMLYEVGSDGTLTSVEYIVPNAEPPGGQTFELVEDLNVWALHALVHKDNPDGIHAGFNPDVGACPSTKRVNNQ